MSRELGGGLRRVAFVIWDMSTMDWTGSADGSYDPMTSSSSSSETSAVASKAVISPVGVTGGEEGAFSLRRDPRRPLKRRCLFFDRFAVMSPQTAVL